MRVPVPFPPADVLLLAALPLVGWLGRALARAATRDRTLRVVLTAPLALALWLSAVHAASLAAGSLAVGLPIATLGLAAAGAAVALGERATRGRADGAGRRPGRALLVSTTLTAALLAPAAFGFWFHDELAFTGHLSIAAALQSGPYPPRHLAMSDVPLRYHYGFDLLTACVTALTRLPIDAAIDVATLGLWCLAWSLFWALGARLVGRRAAWLTPALALFAGGVPLACDRPGPSPWDGVLVGCGVGERALNAPVASYFFQHPFALGLTLVAAAALLLTERRPPHRAARLFALALVLALLSLAEIALFAAALPAVVAAEAFAFGPRVRPAADLGRAAAIVAVFAMSLAAAQLAGGFFARVDSMTPLRVVLHAGYGDGLVETLVWNAKTFGVLLPLGVTGAATTRRGRIFFGLLAAGSLAVVNGARFVGTGDIVKFATIASVALGVLGSAALARLFARATPGRAAAGVALLAAGTGASLAFLAAFALDLSVIPAAIRRAPETLSRDEIDAMTFVRARLRPGELVYHAREGAEAWAEWGGVPQPHRSWTDGAFGLVGPRLYQRDVLLAGPPRDAAAYRAHGIVWLVVAPGDRMGPAAERWIAVGDAREEARFGALRVIDLRAP